jgi:cysteine desulfurase
MQRVLAAEASAPLGNPSSVHAAGRSARALLERAREQVASAFGARPSDLVLTSGGTESCNAAVLGVLSVHGAHGARPPNAHHIVTSAIEHPAVSAPIAALEAQGARVTRLDVPRGIAPDPARLAELITGDTTLVALQWINHETGTTLPIGRYAEVCRTHGVPLFVDATQAAGKLAIEVEALGADLIALASHKLGGPAGAGALWARRGVGLEPLLRGGSQERGRRAGTPDVLASAGFGAACSVLGERLAAQPRLRALQASAEEALRALGFSINGEAGERVASVVSASRPDLRGTDLVAALDLEGVCVSSGAACSSGLAAPSPVLLAMHGEEPERAQSALRLSFGPETQQADLDAALAILRAVLARTPARKAERASR